MLPSLDESPEKVINKKTIRAPAASLELGGQGEFPYVRGAQSLQDSGPGVGVHNLVDGNTYTLPQSQIIDDETFPGITPVQSPEGNAFRFGSFGGDGSELKTVSGDEKITVLFTQVFSAVQTIHKWRGTEGLMHYRFSDTTTFDGEPTFIYSSEDGDPVDFNNPTNPVTGEVTYDTLHPQYLVKDHVMLVEWFSADGNPMTMKGQTLGGVFVPFFDTLFCDVLFKPVATEEYVSNFYASTGFTAGVTETVLTDTVTPVKIAGTYVAGNLKNYTESGGVITAAQSDPSGFITNIFKATQDISARALMEQKPGIESDVIKVGIYRNGTLIPNTLKTQAAGVSFGRNPNPIEFEMSATLTDAADADTYDVRATNTSNATNIVFVDCNLKVGG